MWDINDAIIKFDKLIFGMDISGRDSSNIVDTLQVYNNKVNIRLLRWNCPEQGWFKGSTDEALRENPDPILVAFCIRDFEGNLLDSKGSRIHNTTCPEEKATTIKECLSYYKEKGLYQIIVELNSWTMVQIINRICDIPWSVNLIIISIICMMTVSKVRVVHSLREGNTFANFFLSNLDFDFAGELQSNSFIEIPAKAKSIINLDKKGIPQIKRTMQNT